MTFDRDYWKHNEREVIEFLDTVEDEELLFHLDEGASLETMVSNLERALSFRYSIRHPNTKEAMFSYLDNFEIQQYLMIRFGSHFETVTQVVLTKKKR